MIYPTLCYQPLRPPVTRYTIVAIQKFGAFRHSVGESAKLPLFLTRPHASMQINLQPSPLILHTVNRLIILMIYPRSYTLTNCTQSAKATAPYDRAMRRGLGSDNAFSTSYTSTTISEYRSHRDAELDDSEHGNAPEWDATSDKPRRNEPKWP